MKLRSWNQFKITALSVAPSLMGEAMTFNHKGSVVTVSIPPLSALGDLHDEKALVTRGAYHVGGETFYFDIHAVDVETVCAAEMDLPASLLEQPNNAYGLIDKSQQQQLDQIAEQAGDLAASALDYWISLVRWVTGFCPVGREIRIGKESGWATYLHDQVSLKPVWAETRTLIVKAARHVTTEEWSRVQEHANASDVPPMHIVLLAEAKHCADEGDLRRAIVDMSVACEVYLRTAVLGVLPYGILPEALKQIENSNINQYIGQMFPALLTDEAKAEYKKSIKEELTSLFDRRNKIMHVAETGNLTHEHCVRYQQALQALFKLPRC